MNALFRETTPGLRGVSIFRPRAVGDLQELVDARYKLAAQLDELVDAIREAAREDQYLIDNRGHIDGSHTAVAAQDVSKMERAVGDLS